MTERSFEIHHSHRDVTGGWLRPAVFGASDGLVSNFALIAGVAGGAAAAGVNNTAVAIAGLAGLVAGACSMAAGEYVSVASQRELALAEIELERNELIHRPDAERAELAVTFQRRGLSPDLAQQVAAELSRDTDSALEVHVREELRRRRECSAVCDDGRDVKFLVVQHRRLDTAVALPVGCRHVATRPHRLDGGVVRGGSARVAGHGAVMDLLRDAATDPGCRRCRRHVSGRECGRHGGLGRPVDSSAVARVAVRAATGRQCV